MSTWTEQELKEAFPIESVFVDGTDENPSVNMEPEVWEAWIQTMVGSPKPPEAN